MMLFEGYDEQDEKKDEFNANPFTKLDKMSVLQETRVFQEANVSSRKCVPVLTKLLYMLYHGEVLTAKEATDVFFAVTRLFQSKDPLVRRIVYLIIKELAGIANDTIILTSSLTRDITGNPEETFRANAIRTLCRIVDSNMLQGVERFIKQAIVDKNSMVASAALVSSLHLFQDPRNRDAVRRWVNEVQEAVNSKSSMVSYHALGLIYAIRRSDRMAVTKLLQSLIKLPIRSSLSHCMLIRYVARMIDDEDAEGNTLSPTRLQYLEYLRSCARLDKDIVAHEAARALCVLRTISAKEMEAAIPALQGLLGSPKPTLRFAAIHTLNNVAAKYPTYVANCNVHMEPLVSDPNRSIATLAITTLLKTSSENSVDRLMNQMAAFMSEISDEFKTVVIDAVRALCLKFPMKHMAMLNFLANALREEGSYTYKRAIVLAICDIVRTIPEAREAAIACLLEYIEDCDYSTLNVRVLHFLGEEGPRITTPSACIRQIYNRLVLEVTFVRAAAVSALAKFGARLVDMRPEILQLLKRCLTDNDDEVRDRAVFYMHLLQKGDGTQLQKYILNDHGYAYNTLQKALQEYLAQAQYSVPFDLRTMPTVDHRDDHAAKMVRQLSVMDMVHPSADPSSALPAAAGLLLPASPTSATSASRRSERARQQKARFAEQLYAVAALRPLGPLWASSAVHPLTESETEYVVDCVKHMFARHIVFQYRVRNTLPDQLIEQVSVDMANDELDPISVLPAASIAYDQTESVYVVYERLSALPLVTSFHNNMLFQVRDCDPSTHLPEGTERYPDEYALEDIELSLADYLLPVAVEEDFKQAWDGLVGHEHKSTFELSAFDDVASAVKSTMQFLGMEVSRNVVTDPEQLSKETTSYVLLLSGQYSAQVTVLVRARFVSHPQIGVTMEMAVRSMDDALNEWIIDAIA